MLFSLAIIFLLGMLLGELANRFKLPRLLGMLVSGILLGEQGLNLIDSTLMSVSVDLRQLALVTILIRAGLALNLNDLKKVGRPAILMCFIPACLEIMGMILIAPKMLGVSIVEAAIMGSVVAAVSPAIIVPKMLNLMEKGYGKEKSIPQLIMASASLDDIFVIILFTSFTSLANGENITWLQLFSVPISIITGSAIGAIFGFLLSLLFKKIHIRDSVKAIILISLSVIYITVEKRLENIISFSSLLAVMSTGIATLQFNPVVAKRLSLKFSKIWVAAEILLFVLVGATVNISFAMAAGFKVVFLILLLLLFRVFGVFICLLGTNLNVKERLFCMVSYVPKATVQAAIGGIPLAMGLPCGDIVLTIAVLSIIIAAPIGAFGIDISYKKLLSK
ncbi:MAG: cation:proton antiporter [Oscillospiraceae bacterium]